MLDPEEHVHNQIWRNLKRYLYRISRDAQLVLFSEIAAHSGKYESIHGPIGVLKRSATRLGWDFYPNGTIVTTDLVKLDVYEIPWKRLKYHLHLEWMKIVTDNISHRKECQGLAPISRAHTAKALALVPNDLQRTAALQITGGYSSQARRQPDTPSECPLCGDTASFRHSLFTFAKMAEEYPSLDRDGIDYDDANSIWRIPVAIRHPDEAAFLFTSEQILEGAPSASQVAYLRNLTEPPAIFVDGRRASNIPGSPTIQLGDCAMCCTGRPN